MESLFIESAYDSISIIIIIIIMIVFSLIISTPVASAWGKNAFPYVGMEKRMLCCRNSEADFGPTHQLIVRVLSLSFLIC